MATLGQAHPQANIRATVHVRGAGGCRHYQEDNRIGKHAVPLTPALMCIGGISRQEITSIRSEIRQPRSALPGGDIVIATGSFGTAGPRLPKEPATANHSGTREHGRAL